MTGKKFGILTVQYYVKSDLKNGPIWHCKCECGREKDITSKQLKNNTKSCGCLKSYAEIQITNVLDENNISYIQEYTYEDCMNPKTGCRLRFDFYLPDYNCCIEYDGEQHFKIGTGWNDEDSFKDLQKRDKIKNQYCKDNNIKLIRIPYTDLRKINKEYILSLIKKEE